MNIIHGTYDRTSFEDPKLAMEARQKLEGRTVDLRWGKNHGENVTSTLKVKCPKEDGYELVGESYEMACVTSHLKLPEGQAHKMVDGWRVVWFDEKAVRTLLDQIDSGEDLKAEVSG